MFHNDVDWRHVTVSDGPLDPATLRLVDFNNSFVRPPDRDGWNLCRDMELGSVLSLRERVACMKERCEALGYPLVTSKEAAALAIVKESVTLRRAAVRKERRAAERKEARDNTKRQWQRAIVRLVMPWRR